MSLPLNEYLKHISLQNLTTYVVTQQQLGTERQQTDRVLRQDKSKDKKKREREREAPYI